MKPSSEEYSVILYSVILTGDTKVLSEESNRKIGSKSKQLSDLEAVQEEEQVKSFRAKVMKGKENQSFPDAHGGANTF